jgi:hypothetical protein
MTIEKVSSMVTVTATLTPIQEKAIFGVDVVKYSENLDSISDSTIAILKKLQDGDEEMTASWLTSKTITNQFDYAVLLSVLSKHQESSISSSNYDEINKKILIKLVNIELKSLPSFSNILGWDKLNDIGNKINENVFKDCDNIIKYKTKFQSIIETENNFSSILFYYLAFNYFQNIPHELENLSIELKAYVELFQKKVKFPTATEKNDKEINELMDLLQYLINDSQMNKYLDLYQPINKFIYVTYQNFKVMKLWSLNSINLGLYEESKSTFRTYLDYIKDYVVKHHGEFEDIIDVINTYLFIIEKLSIDNMNNYEEYNELKTWFIKLEIIVDKLIDVIGDDNSIYHLSLKKKIIEIYFSFGNINENFLKFETKPFSKINNILNYYTKSVTILQNAKNLKMDEDKISEFYYKYSFYLHKNKDHDLSLKYSKFAMKFSPDRIKYINFYIKLLTGNEEELDNALLISQQVIENLHDTVSKNEEVKIKSITWKRDAIEAYLIFLTLLGDAALEALAPFFGFVNRIFPVEQHLQPVKLKKQALKQVTTSNEKIDDTCVPCSPSSKEKRLKLLLKPLKPLKPKLKQHQQQPTFTPPTTPISNTSIIPTTSPKQLGQSIRRSLQVSRMKSHIGKVSSNNPPTIESPLTGPERTLLGEMWIVLSRIFQAACDDSSAVQCVDEAAQYMGDDSLGVLARKACLVPSEEGNEENENHLLVIAEAMVDAIHNLECTIGSRGGWCLTTLCSHDAAAMGECVLVFAQQVKKAAGGTAKNADDSPGALGAVARARKHVSQLVSTVAFGDSAAAWLAFVDLEGPSAETVLQAVTGWHGLGIYVP